MEDTIELTNEIPQHTKKAWPKLILNIISIGLIAWAGVEVRDEALTRWSLFKSKIVKEELSNIGTTELTFDKSGKKLRLRDADYRQAQTMMLLLMEERDRCHGQVESIKSALQYGY
jgi:hypothetical protein